MNGFGLWNVGSDSPMSRAVAFNTQSHAGIQGVSDYIHSQHF